MYIEFERSEKYGGKFADRSDSTEKFLDAGWVLTEDDYVVDIDDLPVDTIKKLIYTFDIRTQTVWTERGVHFYFKKPPDFSRGANRVSPLGFKYEIKHAGNTKAVTIKHDGHFRAIDNRGIREDVPFIFSSNKRYELLLGKENGEGRNNGLFKLRTQIAGQKNWRKLLRFVNENIFAVPLEEEEFEVITREMVVIAEKNNEYEVANWLMTELDFLRYGGRYYYKEEDKYLDSEMLLKRKIFAKIGKQKTTYVDEVNKQMMYRCREIPHDTVFNIKLKNGYLKNGRFINVVTDDFSPYILDMPYLPDTEPVEIVDNYIAHLTNSDRDYRQLLLEVLGHTLIVNPEFKRMLAKFFIFEGKGGNGKGTLLQIIKSILGQENCTGMSISDLSDERYLNTFKGKLVNLGDDLQDQAINDKDMKILKNITTCDYITSRELYKNAENMFFTGSLIFTSNHSIKSWEKGESYKRRVMWLPMFTRVEESKKDPLFISKMTTKESLAYWIKLIVEGYMRLYKNKRFTFSGIVSEHNRKYHEENNPTIEFLQDYSKDELENKPVRAIYDTYASWCEDNGVKENQKILRETVAEIFGLEPRVRKINGKSTRCFQEIV